MPSAFVSSSTSPARAPPLRNSRSGWAAPITASPNFGSSSRIVWPPASTPPASRTLAAAAARIEARASVGNASGKAAIESANRTRPPIANTSDRALAAAISPYATGSSTSGGKKSSVPRIARSSATRYAAASSGGSRPARSAGSADVAGRVAPSPASASASRSAPELRGAAAAVGQLREPDRARAGRRAARSLHAIIGPRPTALPSPLGSGGVPVGPPVFKTGGAAPGVARWVRLPCAPASSDMISR